MSLRCLGLLFACVFLVIGVRGKTLEVESHAKETHGEKVVVKTVPFDAKRHRLGYRTIDGQRILWRIDGRDYSGCDGCIPEVEIASVLVKYDDHTYVVPRTAFLPLFNPHLGSQFIVGHPVVTDLPESLSFAFTGGDGAGSYRVTFMLHKKTAHLERQLSEHPDPERAKIRKFRLVKEPNSSVDSDARKSGARGSP